MAQQHLITKQVSWHCKKGWKDCQKCVEVHDYKYALLVLNPSDNPEAARPMIKTPNGWATYDVKQWFNSLEDAQKYSQTNNIPIEIAAEDKYPLLRELSKKLPEKWFLTIHPASSQLEIYSPQTIYTQFENKINAPNFISKDTNQTSKKQGIKGYPSIQYTIKKPLTPSERKEIEQKNTILTQKIKELPAKYNIQHLKPEYVHGKNVYPNYPNATEEEKARIKAYQDELATLEKQYLPTPMYSTPEFDLWNETITGVETATQGVYPEDVSQKTFEVLKIVRDFFSKK